MITTTSSLSYSFGTILASVATFLLTLGVSWILYPAWLVRLAERLEWTVEQLSEDGEHSTNKADITVYPILSLVIPAYNEQDRIPIMLQDAHEYLISLKGIALLQKLQDSRYHSKGERSGLQTRQSFVVEWLIVNDGSNDCTCHAVRRTLQQIEKSSLTSEKTLHCWKIVSLNRNSGKGAAVKTGMNLASGLFHLMVDADGATEFGVGLQKLVDELCEASAYGQIGSSTMMVAFGSRAHLQEKATAQRSFVRTLLMKAFHLFVSLFVSSKIHDTQCGFKLFTKAASNAIFDTLHLRRWAFDTEVVLLCEQLGIRIIEVGVPWHEVDGSKLSTSKLALAIVSITMLRDMICVRLCYTFGIWKIKPS
ncbi:UDP-glucose-undecaprenyl-phosphate glucosyltransferase [Nitzschia inconspicua]|uniref:dolichyl-phosphate beta-glucosyltransferase n=1 Tax=Nitzschia inconspicua TaxID=303405 RepID=A0A9K3M381_9STRA|nr:UDP-glucose-undecaprenyl-phosphate glucosyltransferase [Nitzschia inconspicua]